MCRSMQLVGTPSHHLGGHPPRRRAPVTVAVSAPDVAGWSSPRSGISLMVPLLSVRPRITVVGIRVGQFPGLRRLIWAETPPLSRLQPVFTRMAARRAGAQERASTRSWGRSCVDSRWKDCTVPSNQGRRVGLSNGEHLWTFPTENACHSHWVAFRPGDCSYHARGREAQLGRAAPPI